MFDPQEFLSMTVSETNDTKYTPVPVGDYTAVIDKVDVRSWQAKDDPSKAGLALDIQWAVDDQAVKELLSRDKVIVKQGIMLDLTDQGMLDMGKGRNVSLGRLREAVDLNKPGEPFAFSMLPGRLAKVHVDHKIYKDEPMANVTSVTRM